MSKLVYKLNLKLLFKRLKSIYYTIKYTSAGDTSLQFATLRISSQNPLQSAPLQKQQFAIVRISSLTAALHRG